MRLWLTHAAIALSTMLMGFVWVSGSLQVADSTMVSWQDVEYAPPESAAEGLTALAQSARWQVPETLSGRAGSSLDLTSIKLVGVVLGDPVYVLIEKDGKVMRFAEGGSFVDDAGYVVGAITQNSVKLVGETESLELKLYPGNENAD